MKNHRSFTLLTSAILLALLFSSIQTVLVRADDTLPPPPATEEVVDPVAGGEPVQPPVETADPATGGEPVVQEPAATEAPVVIEEPAATEPPILESIQETVTLPEVLEQLPEETNLVVLDENGEALPLATEAAAVVLAVPDPQFCPAGLSAGNPGCSPSRTTIAGAVLDAYAAGVSGTIYVEPGTFTENVAIDGSFFVGGIAPQTFALVGAGSAFSSLDGWLSIFNMNTFTLSGFTVRDVDKSGNNTYVLAESNTGTMQISDVNVMNFVNTGITVSSHDGNINLSGVIADGNGNGRGGAYLDNSHATGNITISTSQFSNNTEYGIGAYSQGDISLSDVMATGSGYIGAHLSNWTGIGNITVTDSQFNDNGDGILVDSNGNITLSSIIARINDSMGAYLAYWGFTGNVTVTDSQFNENGEHGLFAETTGDITLSGVIADENGLSGAAIANYIGTGSIFIESSQFNDNGWGEGEGSRDGLVAFTVYNIYLSNVKGNDNYASGALLINGDHSGTMSVTDSQFNHNGWGDGEVGDGLVAISLGDITLSNVVAHDNYGGGAYLNNWSVEGTENISVTSSEFMNNGLQTMWDGLYIFSNGHITVQCSRFENNDGYGINAALDGGTLILNGNTFTNNDLGDTYLDGGTLVDNPGYVCKVVSSGKKPITSTGLPLNVIHVTGGEKHNLSCSAFSGTELILPNGDRVIIPCPNGDEASLDSVTNGELPASLDGNFTFISGLDASVEPALIGSMTVSFMIPAGQQDAEFTILHWDGTKWEELGGYKSSDTFFKVQTGSTGIFILASK